MRQPTAVNRAQFAVGSVVALALGAPALFYPFLVARPQPLPANVILITLDTTRADRLAPYGGPSGVMPTIERLAREGVVFDDVSTVAPLTLPAHTSLMTGRMPPSHGVRDNAGVLAADAPTLAEALHSAGYQTAAFVSAVVLDKNRGLARGFDVYGGVNSTGTPSLHRFRRPGSETVDEALAWLEANADSRFFLWVHLYDAHAPVKLAEPFRTAYASDPYEGALALMDSQIGRLQDAVDRRGLSARTAVIVAADHGESLGEHGEQGHGIFVYQSVVHVPLIVRWPGVRPSRVSTAVQLTDITPTLLALEGTPALSCDGRSLVPLLVGRSAPERDVYAESMYPRQFGWSELRSLRSRTVKVIDAPRPELYDLAVDPGEQNNLYTTRPGEAAMLLRRLRSLSGAATSLEVTNREWAKQLGALGYVSSPGRSAPPQNLLPDPKDMIERYNLIEALRPPRAGGQQ